MNTKHKIVKLPTLKKKLAVLRKQGKKIVFTNGCFDIVHYGHISYLETAKKNDRILVLGLNSDSSVKSLKGPERPIISQDKRAGLLAALECVDFVVLFNEDTPLKLISRIKPDVLIKGADYKDKVVVGSDVVKENGGKVEFIKFVRNCSSTNIIEEILKRCKK